MPTRAFVVSDWFVMRHQYAPVSEPLGPRKFEAAERLRVSVQTVDRMVKRGQLDAIKIGRAVVITEASIQRFLRGQR